MPTQNFLPFRLINEQVKHNAIKFIASLPVNEFDPIVIDFKSDSRTLQQNNKFHGMLQDFVVQATWSGQRYDLYGWKNLLVSGHTIASGYPYELVRGLEGELVNTRESTAKMGIKRMASLIEYSTAWGTANGVIFSDNFMRG
ncbi:recombination protein NinB [Gallibacterium sp. AGMB14963]|uniref:recombination protein NinB n=1 Tax=Gallibacterium faecale TaxID=3019086 RepID=UPI0022F1655E|nr:recombination protein NinB [Gallibacterium sp. AGMB14963]MDA3979556.1 recombination protein NinB [Gallibacterium sp. AGMB14963]